MRQNELHKTFQAAARAFEDGNYPKAAKLIKRVHTAVPNEPSVLHLYGLIAMRSGKAELAIEVLEQVMALEPSLDRLNALAAAYAQQGMHEKAIDLLERALKSAPNHTDTHYNLANYLHTSGDAERAASHYQSAIRLERDFTDAHFNLGRAFSDLGRYKDAIKAFETCLKLSPRDADTYFNLGKALVALSDFDRALLAYDKALSFEPDHQASLNNKAGLLKDLGELDEAISLFERACRQLPRLPSCHSNLIYCQHNSPRFSALELKQEASKWFRLQTEGMRPLPDGYANEPRPHKRLSVGYISGDIRTHPVGFFFEPVFENYDKDAFEVHIFSTSRTSDRVTERIRAKIDHWHDIWTLSERELAQFIRDQGIDILIELSGHTEGNRLLTLCYRPAPVQLLSGGVFSTSGLEQVDGLITDRWESPESSETFYSEPLVRMPNGYVCYRPPDYAPSVTPSACLKNGYITFGCFNNLSKITPEVVALWAKILTAVPESRMLLKTTALKSRRAVARYRDLFSRHDVADERLLLEGGLPHEQFLGEYGRVDIALDPFPYSGGLTTLEALWMGVPVITLTGETFAARHSTAHLCNAGLDELVTQTPVDYVRKATAMAMDHVALNELRKNIRDRIAKSPICDGAGYTRDLEALYSRLWNKWRDERTRPETGSSERSVD